MHSERGFYEQLLLGSLRQGFGHVQDCEQSLFSRIEAAFIINKQKIHYAQELCSVESNTLCISHTESHVIM